jgi:hypothetical protein
MRETSARSEWFIAIDFESVSVFSVCGQCPLHLPEVSPWLSPENLLTLRPEGIPGVEPFG